MIHRTPVYEDGVVSTHGPSISAIHDFSFEPA